MVRLESIPLQPPQGAKSSSHGCEPVVDGALMIPSPRRGRHRQATRISRLCRPLRGLRSFPAHPHGLTAVATRLRPLRGLGRTHARRTSSDPASLRQGSFRPNSRSETGQGRRNYERRLPRSHSLNFTVPKILFASSSSFSPAHLANMVRRLWVLGSLGK